ncbi:hypothetical protein niasHT_008927 [Heterodera trifolii]|uniref:Uncharacterized protein n=1 Tax=Heterodera trifolii TaxID=157864 RepID=A0ABD2LY31_9BILA
MRSKFAFFVIFAAIFLLFFLEETLVSGGTSPKHKSAKSGVSLVPKRVTLDSLFRQPSQTEVIARTMSEQWQIQHETYDYPKDDGSEAKGSKNCCTIM